jgi:predicted peptidase
VIRVCLLLAISILAVPALWYSSSGHFTATHHDARPGSLLPTSDGSATAFQERIYRSPNGEQMKYLLFTPAESDAKKNYPVVLWLHGGGSRGEKLSQIIAYGDQHGPLFFAREENQKNFPCFIIAPLCPASRLWANPEAEKPSTESRLVVEILAEIQTNFRVDPRRLYVLGISLGGYGVWDLIARQPGLFAAAIPICGGGNPGKGERMKTVPLWVFHGEKDDLVDVTESRKMVEAVRHAGGKVKYTEYPGVGHMAWEPAFREADLLPWLFAQKRN